MESSAIETVGSDNFTGGEREPFVVSLENASRTVQVGVEFTARPRPRSAVITIIARRSTYDVPPTSGVAWSQHLNRYFCYIEAEGPSWVSGDIQFDEPVDEVSFEVVTWPGQTLWPSDGLRRWAVLARSDNGRSTATIRRVGDK